MYSATLSTNSPPVGPADLHMLASSVVDLLDSAARQLDVNREAARAFISRASSLLCVQIREARKRGDCCGKHRGLLAWQIRRVTEYVESHLGSRILVSDMSAVVQRSKAHFARAFKETLGVSPHAYVVRRRIEKASQLMILSDHPLSDIALACGMTDQAHLCKAFRRMMGRTPAAWRREQRAHAGTSAVAYERAT